MSDNLLQPCASTERSRRYRQRRREGTRCILVDVHEGDVAALVARHYLPEQGSRDSGAIKAAVEALIADLAFELQHGKAARMRSRI
jgi:hypothetical protein